MLTQPPFPQFADLFFSSVKRKEQSGFMTFILQAQNKEKECRTAGLLNGENWGGVRGMCL